MYELVEQLYKRYYKELFRYIKQHVRDEDQIDDIIQNTFLAALKGIEGFKHRSTLKTWLFAIAKNQMYDFFRKNKRTDTVESLPEHWPARDSDFSDKVLADELLAIIDGLPPPHNTIMRLRLLEELPFKQIAQIIGRTENYCRVNYFRTKEKLRKEHDYGAL